jgi:hypothetical protein
MPAVSSSSCRLRRRGVDASTDRDDLALLIFDFNICDSDPSTNFNSASDGGEATALCGPQIIHSKIDRWHVASGSRINSVVTSNINQRADNSAV